MLGQTDYAALAAEIVAGFERGEFEAMFERHAGVMSRGKGAVGAAMFWPQLDEWVGRDRHVTASLQVAATPVGRAVLSGEAGAAAITLLFDDAGKFTDIGVADWPLILGIGNIQIDCPAGTVPQTAALYAALLGIDAPPAEPNWTVLAKDRWTKPALPFAGQAARFRRAAWRDPDRQQQMHLEFFAGEVRAAVAVAEGHGALRIDDDVWLDPAGHALRFEPGESGDAPAVIGRAVIDCPDPDALASFYAELLGTNVRPQLSFRRVAGHQPPRWPDPEFPQQMHMDLKFDDYYGAIDAALRLGATRLPDLGGLAHPAIYADPAGHPFCICFPGQ